MSPEAQIMTENRYEQQYGPIEIRPNLRTGNAMGRALNEICEYVTISDNASVLHADSSTLTDVGDFFGTHRVTNIDPNALACRALKKNGYMAINSSLEAFDPNMPFDVLVAINSASNPTTEIIERVLSPGGILITNNTTAWASNLNNDSSLKKVGVTKEDFRIAPDEEEWGWVVKKIGSIVSSRFLMGNKDFIARLEDNHAKNCLYVFRKES